MDWQGWAMVLVPILLGVPLAGFRWLMNTLKAIDGKLDAQDEKMDKQGERLVKVEQQVTPNHGSSLRDAVDSTAAKVDQLVGSYDQHLRDSEYDVKRHDDAILALQQKK